MTAHVDHRFVHTLENHLFGNLLVEDTRSPLLLGIFGPPGEGKTFQTQLVCRDLGIELFVISPGELESENAGHPAQLLRREYLRASERMIARKGPAALFINDIDTVLGNWGDLVQYTVNRQILYGQLMSFCDFPQEVSGKETRRVPILMTGNDPSRLYAPLLRAGRARVFEWVPDLQAKVATVTPMFPDIQPADVRVLVETHQNQPISFWADLQAAHWELALADLLASQPRDEVLTHLRNGARLRPRINGLTLEAAQNLAHAMSSTDTRQTSYLESQEAAREG